MHGIIFTDVLSPGWARAAGPYRIATELRNAGYSVQVIEFYAWCTDVELRQLIQKFVNEDTLFVGLSTSFLNNEHTDLNISGRPIPSRWAPYDEHTQAETRFIRRLGDEVRRQNQKTKFILGGTSKEPLDVMRSLEVGADYYLSGSADQAILELLKFLKDENHPIRWGDSSRQFIECDNSYPFERFTSSQILYHESDSIFTDEILPIEFSRGCVFSCAFCDFKLNGKKAGSWERDTESFRQELIFNYERFGVTKYMFMDANLNDTPKKYEKLYQVISSLPFKIHWFSFARADVYYRFPEMIHMAKEMGCFSHFFGVETLSAEAGRIVGKSLAPDKVVEALKKTRAVFGPRFSLDIGVIVGLPGEPLSESEKTIDWLLSDDSPVDHWSINALYVSRTQNSRFAKTPEKYNITFEEEDQRSSKWRTGLTNWKEAQQFANYLSKKSVHKNKPGAFYLCRLMNLGIPFEQALSLTQAQLQLPVLADMLTKRIRDMKKQYMNRLLGSSPKKSKLFNEEYA